MTDIQLNYFNSIADELIRYWFRINHEEIKQQDIDIRSVFQAYVLGARKGTFCVLVNGSIFDSMYFEVTQSQDKWCLDCYRKIDRVWREDREL